MPAVEDFPLNSLKSWRAISAEFVATLLFVYVAAGTVVGGGSVVASSLAFGFMISVLIHGVGHISGGHINPAVTLALTATRRIHWKQGLCYIAAQLLGGMIGGLLLWGAMPDTMGPNTTVGLEYGAGCNAFDKDHLGAGKALLCEIMGTFLLVFTVFATIDSSRANTDLGPLQIGLAVLMAHLVGIPQTGTGINPARSFGTAVAFAAFGDSDKWKAAHTGSDGAFDGHWVYWVGPIIGSLAAAFLYDLWYDMGHHDVDNNLKDVFKKASQQNTPREAPAAAQVAPAAPEETKSTEETKPPEETKVLVEETTTVEPVTLGA